MDVLILVKDQDGTVEAMELSDLDDLGPFQALEVELAEFLAEEDVEHLAAAMDPGSVAGVLVYENLWAAPFASAVRRAGGQLIANGRSPRRSSRPWRRTKHSNQKEPDMPLGPGRRGRVGVVHARPWRRPPSLREPSPPGLPPLQRQQSSVLP